MLEISGKYSVSEFKRTNLNEEVSGDYSFGANLSSFGS